MKPGILDNSLTYGFTPYWNAGGYCKVVDWGDGVAEDAVKSDTILKHTYAVAGTYTIRIKANCYQVKVGNSGYVALVYDANGNWDALGNITNGDSMFSNCFNAKLRFTTLPACLKRATYMFFDCKAAELRLTALPTGLTDVRYMFSACKKAKFSFTELPDSITNATGMFALDNSTDDISPLHITHLPANLTDGHEMFSRRAQSEIAVSELPSGLTNGNDMFYGCSSASLPLTSLPSGLKYGKNMFYNCKNSSMQLNKLPEMLYGDIKAMFYGCNKAVINLDELAANAPEGGWTEVTSIDSMFYNAGSGNSPGTVTGSRSAFLAKFPNVTSTTNAFSDTNTTE